MSNEVDVTQHGCYIMGRQIISKAETIDTNPIGYLEGRVGVRVEIVEPGTNIVKRIFDSQNSENIINKVEFSFTEIGCNDFSIRTTEDIAEHCSIRQNDEVRIYIMSSVNPWFTGYLETLPAVNTRTKEWIYKGKGFGVLFEKIIVDETYTEQEVMDIVKDLLLTYVNWEQVHVFPDRLLPLGYVVEGVKFDHVSLKKAFQTIADLANDFIFGVYEDKSFFFTPRLGRPLDRIRNETSHWVGFQVGDFKLEERANRIINKFHIKIGDIEDGSNFLSETYQDLDSIAFFGEREKTQALPEIDNSTDAELWTGYELKKQGWPTLQGKVEKLDMTEFAESSTDIIRAEGYFRVEIPRRGLLQTYYEPLNGYYRWRDIGFFDLYGNNWLKTTFNARQGGTFGRVEFIVHKIGSPGTLTAVLKDGATTLLTLTESEGNLPGFCSWAVLASTYTDKVTIRKNKTYTIEIKATAGDASNYYRVFYSIHDATFSGAYYSSVNGGSDWTENTGRGLLYRTYLKHQDRFLLPIKKVEYTIDPSKGIFADIDLGGVDHPLGDVVIDLLRKIQSEELLQQANISALS